MRIASASARAAWAAAALACLSAACSPTGAGVRPEAGPGTTVPTTTLPDAGGGGPTAPAPEAFGFTFEQELAAGEETWALDAVGRVVDGDVTCRVRASGPGVALDRQWLLVDGALWARDGGTGEYEPTDAGGPAEREFRAFCPRWPADPAAGGLSGLLHGEAARHRVAGVEALGYRGDAAALAAVLGADLGAATAEVFNVWVAAADGWVVEVDLSLSGTGADLGPLLGPLPAPPGRATLTARHRLDLGAAADPIALP